MLLFPSTCCSTVHTIYSNTCQACSAFFKTLISLKNLLGCVLFKEDIFRMINFWRPFHLLTSRAVTVSEGVQGHVSSSVDLLCLLLPLAGVQGGGLVRVCLGTVMWRLAPAWGIPVTSLEPRECWGHSSHSSSGGYPDQWPKASCSR